VARGQELPPWAEYGLLPLLNVALAFLVSGVIVVILGENPVEAMRLLAYGAFGYPEAVGYTLYYATNFIFTGLAVAVAFHAGLFNIGGEGQAYVGGLGLTLAALASGVCRAPLDPARDPGGGPVRRGVGPHPGLAPGEARQPRRDHDDHAELRGRVAAELPPGLHADRARLADPESATYPTSVWLPQLHEVLRSLGFDAAARRSTPRCCWRCSAACWCGSTSGGAGPATSSGWWARASPPRSTAGSRPRGRSSSR
jgi:simple sugar transport system permease protein